jgi:uncharacterized protein YkwD
MYDKKSNRMFGVVSLVMVVWAGTAVLVTATPHSQSLGANPDEFVYLPIIAGGQETSTNPQPGDCLTSEESVLQLLINNYRNDNGLPDVSLARSLVTVAQWHVVDLETNHPDSGTDPGSGLSCNTHSWSNWQPDLWSPVCYVSDHRYASGMWDKPREITDNVYTGNGFENGYWSGGQATAQGAFDGWRNSPAHNAVILETGVWSGSNWPAMGVGIYEHYAVLWFGDASDPQGTVEVCAP